MRPFLGSAHKLGVFHRVTAEHIQDMASRSKRSGAKGRNVPTKGKKFPESAKVSRKVRFARKRKESIERKKSNKRKFAKVAREVAHDLKGPVAKEMRQIQDGDAELVIEAIANGGTARGKCRELGIHVGAVMVRIGADPQLYGLYARARESQAELWAEQLISDADAPIAYDADGANVELGHVKHKADVKRWLMGKYHVRRFGDKVTAVLEGNPEAPLETIHRGMSQEEAMAQFAAERARKVGGQ